VAVVVPPAAASVVVPLVAAPLPGAGAEAAGAGYPTNNQSVSARSSEQPSTSSSPYLSPAASLSANQMPKLDPLTEWLASQKSKGLSKGAYRAGRQGLGGSHYVQPASGLGGGVSGVRGGISREVSGASTPTSEAGPYTAPPFQLNFTCDNCELEPQLEPLSSQCSPLLSQCSPLLSLTQL
jgi:hypothetical protein